MNKNFKRIFSKNLIVLLSIIFSINSTCAVNSNAKASNKKIIKGLGISVGIGIVSFITGKAVLNRTANNWKDVANIWKNISNQYKNDDSPEKYESLAEYYRCLTYKNPNNYQNAIDNYRKAADMYSKRSNKPIDAAKAAEMFAKSCEINYIYGTCSNHECMTLYGNCRTVNYRNAWYKLIGKKPSYNAYARAKHAEAIARIENKDNLWENAANEWRTVQNDQALKDSFLHDNWIAYQAFAEANAQECLLKCHKTTKQSVSAAWKNAYEKDIKCKSNWYKAFAAEAYLRSKLVLLD